MSHDDPMFTASLNQSDERKGLIERLRAALMQIERLAPEDRNLIPLDRAFSRLKEVTKIATEALKDADLLESDSIKLREWRTIDSAPKDGADVLLYFPLEGLSESFEKTIIAHWRKKVNDAGDYWVWQGRSYRGYSVEYQPTHWMPLPSPPSSQLRECGEEVAQPKPQIEKPPTNDGPNAKSGIE